MNVIESIFTTENGEMVLSLGSFLLATSVSLILGFIVAKSATIKQTSSKSFITTLAVLPVIVQVIIMIVNGNIGTGIAVMGTFSLVRFRSLQGNAREIMNIFLCMAIGLATGTGYIFYAAIFAVVVVLANLVYLHSQFAEKDQFERLLKITIPEDIFTTNLFDDLLEEFTRKYELVTIKTTNMGSLYRIAYHIDLIDNKDIKSLIDEIRCRNGNLEVNLGIVKDNKGEL